jgi:hypothetical protein
VKGYVSDTDYPEREKVINNYNITVALDVNGKKIKLSVPHNRYQSGSGFELIMKQGALGILYKK